MTVRKNQSMKNGILVREGEEARTKQFNTTKTG